MNTAAALPWLPSVLVPFFTLSYPVAPPAQPDSFPDSNYFDIGRLDACFIITCIAVMAVARDISRIFLLEPLSRWKLSSDFRRKHALNNKASGNGHVKANGSAVPNGKLPRPQMTPKEKKELNRRVTRFAEQGWSVIYYTLQWAYGLVRWSLCSLALH
jgi:very-long-chain ceramide synthase